MKKSIVETYQPQGESSRAQEKEFKEEQVDYEPSPAHEVIFERNDEVELEISDSEIFESVNASIFQDFIDVEELSIEEEEFEVDKSIVCGLMAVGEN